MTKRKSIISAGAKKFKPSKSELEEFRKTLEDVEEDNEQEANSKSDLEKAALETNKNSQIIELVRKN
jgi:hypothetical protein